MPSAAECRARIPASRRTPVRRVMQPLARNCRGRRSGARCRLRSRPRARLRSGPARPSAAAANQPPRSRAAVARRRCRNRRERYATGNRDIAQAAYGSAPIRRRSLRAGRDIRGLRQEYPGCAPAERGARRMSRSRSPRRPPGW
ncbi:hypothetical protein chiPu_0031594 [Chiloscyllium punctatum]|uniref:Uncharacterized protein n=1 Tax=Chiloscyllium punctatum TaxID=137246 RepID=A0A401TXH5_CHIPU|nr:hypothetical protein [Chiloscyllium punctatum]